MLTRVRRWFAAPVPELAPREAYRLWAENYPPYAHNLLMQVEQDAMCAALPGVAGKRALDLGCGTGRYASVLRERGAIPVGLDFSYEMLAKAQENFARAQAEMTLLPLRAASVDAIISGLAVGHVADLHGALSEMARVLTAGGALLYSDFHAAGSALGWKRTFRAANQTYAVQHYARTDEEHAQAVRAAGFALDEMRAVAISPELAQRDKDAAAFRAQWGDTPVALVVKAHKD